MLINNAAIQKIAKEEPKTLVTELKWWKYSKTGRLKPLVNNGSMQLSKRNNLMKRLFQCQRRQQARGTPSAEDNAPAAVITHPHPLYGGTMHNYVLDTVESAFVEKGYATLRFNFRGVGKSDGRFSDGKGELNDVIGALDYVRKTGPGKLCWQDTLSGHG
jgi:predicted alpha/beta-fold hydrolase